MKNVQIEQNNVVSGLIVGGLAVLGTLAGMGIGFIAGGGVTEFLNSGWVSMLNGTLIGSALSVGLGMLWLSAKVEHITTTIVLRFVAAIILGANISGFIGFMLGGGVNGFLNNGWMYQLLGLVFGGLLSAGIGLIAWASTLKQRRI